MRINLLSILFITIVHGLCASEWQIVSQEFTAAQLEFLAVSEYPVDFVMQIFSKKQKQFLSKLHLNGNLIRLIDRCIDLGFKKIELEQICLSLCRLIQDQSLVSKQYYALKYFRSDMIKKYQFKLKDRQFVQELSHSILIQDTTGKTGLMLAIETGDNNIFDLFLEQYLQEKCPINARNYSKKTALCLAIEKGTMHMVEALYNIEGIATTEIDSNGSTDLMVTTKNTNKNIFDFVYRKYYMNQKYLNLRRIDWPYCTAYLLAAEYRNEQVFDRIKNNPLIDKS